MATSTWSATRRSTDRGEWLSIATICPPATGCERDTDVQASCAERPGEGGPDVLGFDDHLTEGIRLVGPGQILIERGHAIEVERGMPLTSAHVGPACCEHLGGEVAERLEHPKPRGSGAGSITLEQRPLNEVSQDRLSHVLGLVEHRSSGLEGERPSEHGQLRQASLSGVVEQREAPLEHRAEVALSGRGIARPVGEQAEAITEPPPTRPV